MGIEQFNDDIISNASYIRDLARNDPLDGEIYKFCLNVFTYPEDAEGFLDKFVRPFAKEKKCLTDFRSKQKKTLKAMELAAEKARKEQEKAKRKAEREAVMSRLPCWVWIDEKNRYRLDEVTFIEEFSETYQLKYFSGNFFGIDGRVTNLSLSQTVQRILGNYFTEKIAQMTKRVIEGLQNKCYCEEVEPSTDKIHIKDGYLTTDEKGLFTIYVPRKEFCLNRSNAEYSEQRQEPKRFLTYMSQVFKPEDIRTIQQFLGYCLLPTNRLQLCLILNGEGGEGKSQLGQIFADIIGEGNNKKVSRYKPAHAYISEEFDKEKECS